MDKYEYKLKTEEMLELMEDGEYRKAAAAADLIDWKRVRNAGMLMNVSDIYEKTKEYQKSYDVMNLAYRRSEGSRKVIYKLCSLAIKTKNIDEAIDYYDEFIQIAPKDPNRHILRYQILRAQRAPIEQQIEALEEFKKAEYIEEWAYELAKLYREAGMMTECLEECDDLILWFSEGKYVYKAMELKMQYKPLSPSQQQKYDHRYEKLSSETEEIPDLTSYLGEDEEKDSALEGAEALGDTRSIGLTEQPVMENDSTSDVIDTDAVTLEAAEEPDAEVENPEEAGVETAEVIEASEDESEVQPATVETSGDKRTLSKDTASIPVVGKNPVKPVKKKLGDTMRLDEALQQLLNPKPEVQAEPGEEVEPDMTDLEEDIAAIEDVEDLEIVNQLTEEKKGQNNRGRIEFVLSGKLRCGSVRCLKNGSPRLIINVCSGSNTDAPDLCRQRIRNVISVKIHCCGNIEFIRIKQRLLKEIVANDVAYENFSLVLLLFGSLLAASLEDLIIFRLSKHFIAISQASIIAPLFKRAFSLFHDVSFMHERHVFSSVTERIINCSFDQSHASFF